MEKPATPEWLNKSFLQNAIGRYRNDETIDVLEFTISTNFSEHFASTMFQSKVDFKSMKYPKSKHETLNVVIKVIPMDDDLKKELVAGAPLFETEIQMYNESIPAIDQLFERSGLKVKLGPELIYATLKPFPVIMLKDLSADGFYAPRTPRDNLEDTKQIIERLAQFHAASFYLTETSQQDFSNYNHTIYKSEAVIKSFFQDTLLAFKEVVSTWEDCQFFLPKLDYLFEHIGEIGRKCYVPNKPGEGYNVLNHGDFHMRNLLVKDNAEKRLEGHCFIDFQTSVYCSPAIDITYMFSVVKRDEEGNLPAEELIMFYHQEFVKTLKTFGYLKSPPSLLDVNVELLKHGAMSVLLSICFIPFNFVDWENMTAEDMLGNDSERSRNFKKSLYEHPVCKMLLQKEMKSWIHKGWL